MQFLTELYWNKGKRKKNEDTVVLQEAVAGGVRILLAAVCDGIGGLAEGETASGFVGERLINWFHTEVVTFVAKNKSRRTIQKAGMRVLYSCQEKLKEYGRCADCSLGTTATVLLLWKNQYILWHSGDSRIYFIKGHKQSIRQLTRDHTVSKQQLVKCIGSFPWQEPDTAWGRFGRGEGFLICSDGYCRLAEEERLREVFAVGFITRQEQLYRRMKGMADYLARCGESDNMSAIVVLRKGRAPNGSCHRAWESI